MLDQVYQDAMIKDGGRKAGNPFAYRVIDKTRSFHRHIVGSQSDEV